MPHQTIWLSYDLGVRGDYAGLYSWLDARKAKECGESTAWFSFLYKKELVNELVQDLKSAVEVDKRTRFYAIFHDPKSGKRRGRFIVGNRKASPWTGYAPNGDDEDDEVAE